MYCLRVTARPLPRTVARPSSYRAALSCPGVTARPQSRTASSRKARNPHRSPCRGRSRPLLTFTSMRSDRLPGQRDRDRRERITLDLNCHTVDGDDAYVRSASDGRISEGPGAAPPCRSRACRRTAVLRRAAQPSRRCDKPMLACRPCCCSAGERRGCRSTCCAQELRSPMTYSRRAAPARAERPAVGLLGGSPSRGGHRRDARFGFVALRPWCWAAHPVATGPAQDLNKQLQRHVGVCRHDIALPCARSVSLCQASVSPRRMA